MERSVDEQRIWLEMENRVKVCQCNPKDCMADLITDDYVCCAPEREKLAGLLEVDGDDWDGQDD